MAIRYTDMDSAAEDAKEFAVRERKPDLKHVALLFIITCAIAIGMAVAVNNKTLLSALLLLLLGGGGWYVIFELQRHRDLVLATEFQNALFASALGLNHKFCLIIKRDGNIIYLDRSFQKMFPDFATKSRRTIGTLLKHALAQPDDIRKVFDAIERSTYDKVIFTIHDSHGDMHRIVMSIEPILRPSGFILLRGRQYIEKRQGESGGITAKFSTQPTITLFSHVMDSMKIGVYMTSPDGHIIYANPLLEQWLGFAEDEISSSSLMISDILYQPGDTALADHEGVIIMRKKNGDPMKSFINQKVISDSQGRPIGCTAIAHYLGELSADFANASNYGGF